MRKFLVFFIVILIGCSSKQHHDQVATNIAVEPKGEFAEINLENDKSVISQIEKGDLDAFDLVMNNPSNYTPVMLYALSNSLFMSGKKDESLAWFYLAQLRARSDANKSLDLSARSAVTVLNNKFGPLINQYAFENIELLKNSVNEALSKDVSIGRNYDPRWIALHGMGVFDRDTVQFEPEEKWEEINQKTREDYEQGLKEALKSMEQQND